MPKLSPAAQAVLNAWEEKLSPDVTCLTHDPEREALAAAPRAAADQVVPLRLPPERAADADSPTVEWHAWNAEQQARFALLAIATELEAQ